MLTLYRGMMRCVRRLRGVGLQRLLLRVGDFDLRGDLDLFLTGDLLSRRSCLSRSRSLSRSRVLSRSLSRKL